MAANHNVIAWRVFLEKLIGFEMCIVLNSSNFYASFMKISEEMGHFSAQIIYVGQQFDEGIRFHSGDGQNKKKS